MIQASEQIASQMALAAGNKAAWYDIAYNVKSYGAKGDGKSDDTSNIQKVLNLVSANGGGVVLFPPGTYRTSSLLYIGNNTTVRGSGGMTVIKPIDNYPSSISPVRIYGVFVSQSINDAIANYNITIEDLVIDGNREGNPASLPNVTPPIHIYPPANGTNENIRVQNVEIKNLWKTPTTGTFGMWFEGCRYVWVTNCHVHGTGRDGIAVSTGCKYVHISNNTIYNTEDDGISLYSTATDPLEHVIVTDNILYNVGSRGIHLAGGRSIILANNTIDTTAAWGILVTDENLSPYIEDIQIHNNTIRNSSKYTDAILNSYIVGQCGGIFLENQSTTVANWKRISVSGNIIYNSAKEGIKVDSSSSTFLLQDISFDGNTCDKSGTNGISFTRKGSSLMPKNVKINDNTINLSGSEGVKFFESVTNLSFIDNEVFDSGATADVDGVQFANGAKRAILRGNFITDTRTTKHQAYGISIIAGTFTDTVIEHNELVGNKTGGIFLGSQVSMIQNNRGFNPVGWAGFLTPAIPAAGFANAVTNSRSYPIRIHQKGGVGVGVVDVNGAAGDGSTDTTSIRLLPGEKIYFNTTAPTYWAWYGE